MPVDDYNKLTVKKPIKVSKNVYAAVNTKKETAGKIPGSHGKTALPTVSTISILNLLDYVNKYSPDILPEDVLRHYKHEERPSGDFSKDVLFSDRDSTTTTRSILANVLEAVAQNDIEKNKLAEYKEKISQIESEEQILSEIQKKHSQKITPSCISGLALSKKVFP